MRNYFFTAITLIIITGAVQAQHVNIGIKGGLNAFTITGDNSADFKTKIGYNIGLLGHIHMGRQFALQPEIVYSVQGAQSNTSGNDRLNLNYVNIPLIFQYMYDNGFRLQAGPQLGILASANSIRGSATNDVKASYKSTDIGLTAGMSYVKPSTGLGFDLRYNHGLTNINVNNLVNSYNRGVQIGIFYLFGHKS